MTEERKSLPELPKGWVWTTLDEIAQIILGQSPPSSTYNEDGVGLPFYQGKAEFGDIYPTPRKWCSQPKKIAEKGDVLISVRAPVGPTNICPEKSCIGRGLAAIRGLDGIQPRFILYLMRSSENVIVGRGTGTTFKAITGSQLRGFEIPLPPLPEQQRIVAKIEELFTQLDAGVAALEKAKAQLRRYRLAVLKAAVGGELTREWREAHQGELEPAPVLLERILEKRRTRWEAENPGKRYKPLAPPDTEDLPKVPEGWAWASLRQLADKIQYGHTESATEEPIGPKFLRITDIQDGRVNWDTVPYCKCSEEQHAKYRLVPGDIVFTRTGATTGKSYLISDCPDAVFASYLIRLQISKQLDTKYVALFLTSPIYWSQIMIVKKGSAQPGVNATILATLRVPFPPLAEQQRIVAEVEQRLSVADEMEKTVEQSLKRAERLRQSILKRAFEGKLAPQDPSDEAASVLLERIQAEKARREGERKGRGKGSRRKKQKAAKQQQLEMF